MEGYCYGSISASPFAVVIWLWFYSRALSVAENKQCLTLGQSMNRELERMWQKPLVA